MAGRLDLGYQTNSRAASCSALLILEARQPKCPSFLVDMCDVVGYVLDFGLEHFLECDQPAFAMHASASPGSFRQRAQHQSHLGAHPFHEGELGIQVVLVVAERCREPALVVADQERPFLGDDPLHAVAPGLFAVDQVADDLERAPLAGNRPRFELRGAHVGNGPSQLDWAIEIRVDLLAKRDGGMVLISECSDRPYQDSCIDMATDLRKSRSHVRRSQDQLIVWRCPMRNRSTDVQRLQCFGHDPERSTSDSQVRIIIRSDWYPPQARCALNYLSALTGQENMSRALRDRASDAGEVLRVAVGPDPVTTDPR